jgi:uncharacterized SAM-binding protein YcdF (DUF218 family)
MAFLFGKVLFVALRPSNLLLLLALVGVIGLARRARWGAALVSASVVVTTACTLLPVGGWLTIPLENRFARPSAYPERVDGVVVLGGGIDGPVTQARGAPSFRGTLERFAAIPELARRYPEAKILFTGGIAWGSGTDALTEAAVVGRFLAEQGLPEARVVLEDRARSTRDNALLALPLARPRPGERWLLVTSAKHMPRSIGVFRGAGWPELEPWPVDYRTTGRGWDLSLGPAMAARLDELDEAAYEWYALAYYRLLGYTGSLLPGPPR